MVLFLFLWCSDEYKNFKRSHKYSYKLYLRYKIKTKRRKDDENKIKQLKMKCLVYQESHLKPAKFINLVNPNVMAISIRPPTSTLEENFIAELLTNINPMSLITTKAKLNIVATIANFTSLSLLNAASCH